jgi:hypothetical protein
VKNNAGKINWREKFHLKGQKSPLNSGFYRSCQTKKNFKLELNNDQRQLMKMKTWKTKKNNAKLFRTDDFVQTK